MLDRSILKENIDGEALLWASRRLLTRGPKSESSSSSSPTAPRSTRRRSRKTPTRPSSTATCAQAIAEIEATSPIELAAIGVKHDVAKYYRNSIQIDDVESLGEQLVRMIDVLLTR